MSFFRKSENFSRLEIPTGMSFRNFSWFHPVGIRLEIFALLHVVMAAGIPPPIPAEIHTEFSAVDSPCVLQLSTEISPGFAPMLPLGIYPRIPKEFIQTFNNKYFNRNSFGYFSKYI